MPMPFRFFATAIAVITFAVALASVTPAPASSPGPRHVQALAPSGPGFSMESATLTAKVLQAQRLQAAEAALQAQRDQEARKVAAERLRRSQAVSRQATSTPSPARSAPAPAPTPSGGDQCAYAGLIRSVWQRDAEWAISIAWRESRCQPDASNSSGAHGLFQMLGHHDIFVGIGCPNEFSAECNVRAAWALYQGSGRSPWNL